MVDEGLGAGFWLKIFGMILLGGIGALLLFLLIDAAWIRWGGLGALIFFFVVLGAIAYSIDRREHKRYEEDLA
jgi:hypothetical protein